MKKMMTKKAKQNATDFKEKISNGEPMRLNKFLSDAGVCSRRQADRYVEQGRILVDGEISAQGFQNKVYRHIGENGSLWYN